MIDDVLMTNHHRPMQLCRNRMRDSSNVTFESRLFVPCRVTDNTQLEVFACPPIKTIVTLPMGTVDHHEETNQSVEKRDPSGSIAAEARV